MHVGTHILWCFENGSHKSDKAHWLAAKEGACVEVISGVKEGSFGRRRRRSRRRWRRRSSGRGFGFKLLQMLTVTSAGWAARALPSREREEKETTGGRKCRVDEVTSTQNKMCGDTSVWLTCSRRVLSVSVSWHILFFVAFCGCILLCVFQFYATSHICFTLFQRELLQILQHYIYFAWLRIPRETWYCLKYNHLLKTHFWFSGDLFILVFLGPCIIFSMPVRACFHLVSTSSSSTLTSSELHAH